MSAVLWNILVDILPRLRKADASWIRRFFFSTRVIDRWNRLQQSVIDSRSVNSFKNGLDAQGRQRWASSRTIVDPLSPLAKPVLKILLQEQDRCGRTWYVTCWYRNDAFTSYHSMNSDLAELLRPNINRNPALTVGKTGQSLQSDL